MRSIFKISLIILPTLSLASFLEANEDLKVRQAPSSDSKVVKTYPKGSKIKFSNNFGSWYKVKDGFMFAKNMEKKQEDENSKEIKSNETPYIKYFEDLDIYEEDNSNSKKIGKLNSNTIIEVECETNNISDLHPWYKTIQGYLNSPYLYNPKNLESCEEDKKIVVPKTQDIPQEEAKTEVAKVEEKQIEEPTPIQEEKKPELEDKKEFFAGVILGVNKLSVNSENKTGSVTINSPLDDTAYSFNIHVGTNYNENYRIIANYDHIPLDDITLQNYYLSLNYQWDRYLNPYVGISTGISSMTWESDPLTNSTSKDTESQASGFVGLQGGIEYKYNKDYSFISQILYQEFFHKTNITSGSNTAEITHDRVFQLGLGLRYSF